MFNQEQKIGKLSKQISEELGINEIDVIAVAGHDTQSAMVAVPTQEDDFIFLSCGTWFLIRNRIKNTYNQRNFRKFEYY